MTQQLEQLNQTDNKPQEVSPFLKYPHLLARTAMTLTLAETRVFQTIVNYTCGWNKSEAIISLSVFEQYTLLSRTNITRAIKSLVAKGLVIKGNAKLTDKTSKGYGQESSVYSLDFMACCIVVLEKFGNDILRQVVTEHDYLETVKVVSTRYYLAVLNPEKNSQVVTDYHYQVVTNNDYQVVTICDPYKNIKENIKNNSTTTSVVVATPPPKQIPKKPISPINQEKPKPKTKPVLVAEEKPKKSANPKTTPSSNAKHPAVQAWRKITKRYPRDCNMEKIVLAVGDSEKNLALWESLLSEWAGNERWNIFNVDRQVTAFRERLEGVNDGNRTQRQNSTSGHIPTSYQPKSGLNQQTGASGGTNLGGNGEIKFRLPGTPESATRTYYTGGTGMAVAANQQQPATTGGQFRLPGTIASHVQNSQ